MENKLAWDDLWLMDPIEPQRLRGLKSETSKLKKKNFKILIINEINFPKTFRSSTTLKRLSVFFNPLSGVPTRIRQGERKFPGTSAEIGNFMT